MKQTNPSKTTLKTQPWIHKYIDIEKKKKKKKKKTYMMDRRLRVSRKGKLSD